VNGEQTQVEHKSTDQWVRGTLPPFNRLVVAYLVGFKEHSGMSWKRDGWAFMVRHDDREHTVADMWASDRYNAALKSLDADHLDVLQWMPLERPQ